MVCVDGITITALQYFMPILKSSHFFAYHPSFILRSSFVHPSIGSWRMIIGYTEDNMKMKRNISHRQFIAP